MAETDFGKYKLIAELGHGGMADVFLAVQGGFSGSGFRKLTVVKRLRKNLAFETEFVAMLVDEARIAARLNHANVVQTNEVGEFQGQYFIAMEYLDGQSLHMIQHRSEQLQKKGQPTPYHRELSYVILLDVLAGLHHAHELADYDGTPLEIVHRDVTPHNIFVTYDGQVKVVDFGIAKAARRGSETRQGILKGKVRYMAPEQTIGKNVDRRADLFAAGIMLWEAATGHRLWQDKDDLEIVQQLVAGEFPRSPRSVNPEVPEAIDAICVKALAQKAADRYATAADFRNDLEQFLTDTGKLSPARRQLPPALDALFKDKRAEIRAVIEKQLQALENSDSDFSAVEIGGGNGADGTRSNRFSPDEGFAADESDPDEADGEFDEEEDDDEPRRGPSVFVLAAAVIVVTVLIAGAIALGVKGSSTPPPVATINVNIRATPATAKVRVDEGPLEPVPFGQTVPKDNRQHRVHVEAVGYQPKDDNVIFGQDVMLSFDLLKDSAQPTTTVLPIGSTAVATTAPTVAPVVKAATNTHRVGTAHTAETPAPTAPPAETVVAAPTAPATTAAPPPTVAPPPTPATPGPEVAAEHRKAVNRAIRGHVSEVQACFDRAKVSSPQLTGNVTVGATLTPSGTVSAAHVANSTANGAAGPGARMLEQCLVDRFRTWTFPAVPPGASSDISYVFRFE